MRALLVSLVTCVVAAPLVPAAAAPAGPVVIVPPAGDGDEAEALALLVQTRATALLVKTGRFDELHAKQVRAVADRERLTPAVMGTSAGAATVARRLGAARAVYGTLEKKGGGWQLTAAATTADGKPIAKAAPVTVELPAELPKMVDEAALALARLAAAPDGVKVAPPAGPLSASAEAVAAYASCLATLVRQPVGVETPVVLEVDQMRAALGACRKALEADPRFVDAQAALGLAQALVGDDADAVRTLAGVKEERRYLPFYWIGRYWLVTHFQSVDAGAKALQTAIQRHPYFLLAYGYLAEHHHALHRDAAALAAWRSYQKRLPRNLFIRGRISRSLARAGKLQEGLGEARAASAVDPDDREAQLELASRHIDAGKPRDAIGILRPLADDPAARAEILLRLGFAYARADDWGEAEKWFRKADAAAQRPADWRTRARARADIGLAMLKLGRTEEGQRMLRESTYNGAAPILDPDEPLARALSEATARPETKIEGGKFTPPQELSPFRYDGAGAIINDDRDPPPEPKMFEVLRF